MMIDRNVSYCVYFVSFRDDDEVTTYNINQTIGAIQAQNLQLFSIKLGPINKDTANNLVSRILVSIEPSLYAAIVEFRTYTFLLS